MEMALSIRKEFERFSDVCLWSSVDATSCVRCLQHRKNSSAYCQPISLTKTIIESSFDSSWATDVPLKTFDWQELYFPWHHRSARDTNEENFDSDVYPSINAEFMTCKNATSWFHYSPDVPLSQYDWIPNKKTCEAEWEILCFGSFVNEVFDWLVSPTSQKQE